MPKKRKVKTILGSQNADRPRFRSEKELVDLYVSQTSLKAGRRHLIRKEFDVTNGVADIVEIVLKEDWADNISLGQINGRWAYALRMLPLNKLFKLKDFQVLSGTSSSTALKILNHYTQLNYCVRSKLGWIKKRQAKLLAKEITSIEAKLYEWRKALVQAYRHLDYAYRSYVLLDAFSSKTAQKNIALFKRLNIGLIILAPDHKIKVLFKPKRRSPKSEIRHWHANSEVVRRLFF